MLVDGEDLVKLRLEFSSMSMQVSLVWNAWVGAPNWHVTFLSIQMTTVKCKKSLVSLWDWFHFPFAVDRMDAYWLMASALDTASLFNAFRYTVCEIYSGSNNIQDTVFICTQRKLDIHYPVYMINISVPVSDCWVVRFYGCINTIMSSIISKVQVTMRFVQTGRMCRPCHWNLGSDFTI